jgi:hypothetical protein
MLDRVRWLAAPLAALLLALTALPALAAQDAAAGEADLVAVKTYVVDQAAQMKEGSAALKATAEQYYLLIEEAGFDYEAAWAAHQVELTQLVADAKERWLTASRHYELNEGLIAGVPSLSYYDVWIDAGPSGEEDPAEALDWTLELPNGESFEKPGNIFGVTEPGLWGTQDEAVGLRIDVDGDGELGLGEVLPEANLFVAGARVLDQATDEMIAAVDEWQPTIEDAFAALTTMIPTMNEYFEQWKLSTFVSGEASTQTTFVANSRLLDVGGILNGLSVTYDEISPIVVQVDPALHAQIDAGFADLEGFVADLSAQEQGGTQFTPEQADLFGTEAQDRATRLVGQVSQAIALLGIQV